MCFEDSFKFFTFLCFLCLLCLLERVYCNRILWSDSTILTVSSPSSSLASVTLVENGDYNYIVDSQDSLYPGWECYSANYDSFCVYVSVFGSDCDDIEILEISMSGRREIGTNTDIMTAFSCVNSEGTTEWISYANDYSGGFRVDKDGDIGAGGVFAAPNCASNTLFSSTNSIVNLFDSYNIGNAWDSRLPFVNNDINKWELLTSDRVGDSDIEEGEDLHYRLENDKINNQVRSYFNSENIDQVSCVFDTIFDTNGASNWIIPFMTDQGTVKFTQFNVTLTCEVCVFFYANKIYML